MGSVADEEIRWRTILTNIGAQIEANGGEVSAFMQAQLAFLDNADGSFEGDDIARIRNSMLTACQNLLAEIRPRRTAYASDPPKLGVPRACVSVSGSGLVVAPVVLCLFVVHAAVAFALPLSAQSRITCGVATCCPHVAPCAAIPHRERDRGVST
jgi:hypothetical protein